MQISAKETPPIVKSGPTGRNQSGDNSVLDTLLNFKLKGAVSGPSAKNSKFPGVASFMTVQNKIAPPHIHQGNQNIEILITLWNM